MKKNIVFIIIVLFSLFCDSHKNPLSFNYEYVSRFFSEPRPIAIAVDEENRFLYVANSNQSRSHDSRKIQKYNRSGDLLKTIVDFTSFDKGNYPRYHPLDISLDSKNNLYILCKPYQQHSEDNWWPLEGFSILKYGPNDEFQKEYDFGQYDQGSLPAVIANYDNFIYVTNGRIIRKISTDTGQAIDIALPVNENNVKTWPDIHTTDMSIDSDGLIYLVGQVAFDSNSVGCHITTINLTNGQRSTVYSNGKTGLFAAMLNNPGLSIDSKGNIYLATFYCKSVEIFNRKIKYVTQIELDHDEALPIDVSVDKNHIYVVDNLNNYVSIYNKK